MNRRQLAFLVLVNALVSTAIALAVVWFFERHRPDPELLAARFTPPPPVLVMVTPVSASDATPIPTTVSAVPAATTSTAAPQEEQVQIYVVEEGDSLLAIALRYGVTVDELIELNSLENPDFVYSGQRLRIPARAKPAEGAGQPMPMPTVAVQIRAVDSSGNLDGESVLLVNESDTAVNLQGWTLSRDGGPVYTFGDLPLFPGGSVRLHSTGGVDSSADLYWAQPAPVWLAGTAVRLLNPAGDPVHSYTVP